tara:strand:+ start:296 stop:571 length:276 start_codon:yes stop_codon:yes gene_type:complete
VQVEVEPELQQQMPQLLQVLQLRVEQELLQVFQDLLLQEAVVAVELVFRRQLEEQVELVVVVPELLQEMEQTEQIILVAEVGVHKVVIQAA